PRKFGRLRMQVDGRAEHARRFVLEPGAGEEGNLRQDAPEAARLRGEMDVARGRRAREVAAGRERLSPVQFRARLAHLGGPREGLCGFREEPARELRVS